MNAYDMYSTSQQVNVNKMVAEHAELVKKIAFHLMNRLPSTVQVEDLIQSGNICQHSRIICLATISTDALTLSSSSSPNLSTIGNSTT